MKAYIINLERDTDRREYMERLVREMPFVEPEFVSAVYGRALGTVEKRRVFDQRRFGYVFSGVASDGEIGCAVSHYNVWRRMTEEVDNVAFVFEDDVLFEDDFRPLAEWSVRWLDSPKPRAVLFSHYFFYLPWNRGNEGGYFFSSRPRNAFGTYCYGINKAGARLLTALGKPHYLSDDWDYFQKRGLEMRAPLGHPVSVDYGFEANIVQRSAYVVSKLDAGAQLVVPCRFSRVGEFYRLIIYKAGLMRFYGKG